MTQKAQKPLYIASASPYPLEVKAIPYGEKWLIIFSGVDQAIGITDEVRDVLVADAIARAKAERGETMTIDGFGPHQLEQIRRIVREELEGRDHDNEH